MLIAVWWRKGDRGRWSESDLATLIDMLAERPPDYQLPKGAIRAHTRHYMPQGKLSKGRERTALVFDGFVHLAEEAEIVAAWPDITLNSNLFELAADLAESVSYLGRAESWAECRALDNWIGETNCETVGGEGHGVHIRVLAPLSPATYAAKRQRLIANAKQKTVDSATYRRRSTKARNDLAKAAFISKSTGADTVPARLVDALALDTADYQDCGWSRPPAAREVVYVCAADAIPGVIPRDFVGHRYITKADNRPTIARFLVAGRPLPRIEDTLKIGELMRRATLAQFGWETDEATGRTVPRAPWPISGRRVDGRPLADPKHSHAFWLPEDADSDGWIDHISVYIENGIDNEIRTRLDNIIRLWQAPRQRVDDDHDQASVKEWRLALEGFGRPSDFAGSARIFGEATNWQSTTPFLAAGHLKTSGYPGEVLRILRRRGLNAEGVEVEEIKSLAVGGTELSAHHFHRFRSRGGEKQPDTAGSLLRIIFPRPITGPLAIGFGSHFGLGMFKPED